ncbi:MAG: MerR family transcriptional regulator [Candidatus Krumholzibacteria bacterium]|nr:MerR family transcriptional regulator [Candidatus Krumholzibacteria bacterium]
MKANQKLYYSIGEVSDLLKVKPHVLRYWESQFPVLSPKKNRAGNRTYRVRDIRLLIAIQTLLYDRKYTIAGARRKLKDFNNDPSVIAEQLNIPFADPEKRGILTSLRKDLLKLRELVEAL